MSLSLLPTTVLDIALTAATSAGIATNDALGGDRGDCGSAWVVLPARSPILKALRAETGIRTHKHHAGGVAFALCSGIRTQSRFVFEKACDAFVGVCREHGFDARVYSFAD